MAVTAEFVPNQAATEAVEAHVIWMTTGLSCDGDSVAMTSAVNPSLEDIITQAIPGMPKVIVHNPVLAYENGAEFIEWWWKAERGELDPFVLCVEGSIPNEKLSGEGHLAAIGDDPETGQPITTSDWLDRLAPKAAAVVAIGTCATYGGIPAMKNNPTGAMGVADHLGWNWKSSAGLPVVNIPGCPAQPDNMTETLLYLALHLAGLAPVPDLDELRPPDVAVRPHRPRGLQPRRLRRAGPVRHRVRRRPALPGQAGLQGAGGEVQRAGPRLGRRLRRLPERGRDLHGLHDARLPRQVHAVHGPGRRRAGQGRTSSASSHGPMFRYFRNRNIKNKYDVEPEWRKPGKQLLTGYASRGRLPPARQLAAAQGSRDRLRLRSTGGDSMATVETPRGDSKVMVKEMSWDPITRIVGTLGIHTEIDFTNQRGPEVLQHLDDLPRVRHLHEGDRPARRALHHRRGSAASAVTTTAPAPV